jgi:hypothetical protein
MRPFPELDSLSDEASRLFNTNSQQVSVIPAQAGIQVATEQRG